MKYLILTLLLIAGCKPSVEESIAANWTVEEQCLTWNKYTDPQTGKTGICPGATILKVYQNP